MTTTRCPHRSHLFPWIEDHGDAFRAGCACGWAGATKPDVDAAAADAWWHEHEEERGRVLHYRARTEEGAGWATSSR